MILNERYQLDKQIGEGGENIVYLATDLQTEQKVILKRGKSTLQGAHRKKWLDEATLLRQIHLPGVVSYIDSFVGTVEMAEYGYIVQDFIDGTSLEKECQNKRYTQDQVKQIIVDVLTILVQLQELSPPVIHRDIKPANIMRRAADQQLLLIDFGLAMDHAHNDIGHTMAAGTLGYQSPEQISGYPTPASDVYSVGVIAVELLSRRRPQDMLWGQALKWESSVITVRQEWKQWLRKALAEESERFQTAAEALEALKGASPPKVSVVHQPQRSEIPEVQPIPQAREVISPPPVQSVPRRQPIHQNTMKQAMHGMNAEQLHQRLQTYKMISLASFCVFGFFAIVPFLYFHSLQKEVSNNQLQRARAAMNMNWWWLGLLPVVLMCGGMVSSLFMGMLSL